MEVEMEVQKKAKKEETSGSRQGARPRTSRPTIMWASLGSLGDGVVFDTPVTSPVKSPKKRPAEFPLPPVETETQAAQSSMLTPSAFGQLYSTTLLVLIVAATASIATNRISEVLFVMLGLYLLWRGLLSSFLPNLLAPVSAAAATATPPLPEHAPQTRAGRDATALRARHLAPSPPPPFRRDPEPLGGWRASCSAGAAPSPSWPSRSCTF